MSVVISYQLSANYSDKHMRDQKVWSLPKFERLHMGGWA